MADDAPVNASGAGEAAPATPPASDEVMATPIAEAPKPAEPQTAGAEDHYEVRARFQTRTPTKRTPTSPFPSPSLLLPSPRP